MLRSTILLNVQEVHKLQQQIVITGTEIHFLIATGVKPEDCKRKQAKSRCCYLLLLNVC